MEQLLHSRFQSFIKPAVTGIVVFIVGMIIAKMIANTVKRKITGKYDSIDEDPYSKKVGNMVGTMIYYVLMLFVILITFQIMGFDVAILMAGISFGIGFGMEKTLSNMVAGIMLATNPKIRTGETIEILGDYQVFGKIEKMSARNTIVRLFTGRSLILPNKKFLETPVKVRSQEPYVRQQVTVGIGLEANILHIKKILRKAVNNYPHVVQKDKTFINSEMVDESGITLNIYFYIQPGGKVGPLQIKSDIRNIILQTFAQQQISIPFPHQILDLATT